MKISQIIDFKQNCPIIYHDGQFLSIIPNDIDATWNYSFLLRDKENIQIAKLYCQGKSLEEVCPIQLKSKWLRISKKMSAFHTSLKESKANYNEFCLLDLIPENVFKEYCDIKNQICSHVFKIYPKPINYDFLVDVEKLIFDIERRTLNVEGGYSNHISYNQFGAINGRMTTKHGSFPILTLNKKDRHVLKPQNDFFLSLDYIAAELRTLCILLEKEIPYATDLHEWNAKNIFKGNISREDVKKTFFAWLYNPAFVDEKFEKHYPRNKLIDKFYKDGKIKNPFEREINCDKDHAVNYLVSSTLTDIFLRQAIKVDKYLKSQKAKSFISFMIHDNISIDVCGEEKEIIKKVIDIFQETCYGRFMISESVGKNFGEMKDF